MNNENQMSSGPEKEFKGLCEICRKELKGQEIRLRAMMNNDIYKGEQKFINQHNEIKAQTMLAVRHIEDARMRIGKMLQYADDGVSILDK